MAGLAFRVCMRGPNILGVQISSDSTWMYCIPTLVMPSLARQPLLRKERERGSGK